MNLNAMLTRWKRARRYGYRSDPVSVALSGSWERFWRCRVQRQHLAKFSSPGTCYRCGKALR